VSPRGGKRKGAGRKALPESVKRVPLSVLVLPATKHWLDQLAEAADMSLGQIIDDLVADAIRARG